MNTFLILDTCGVEGRVAVAAARQGQVTKLTERTLPGRTFSSNVVTAVREVLAEAAMPLAPFSLNQIDAIVVMHGPGSFTGVRVGLSTAKGLAHASGVKVIALSRLAVMAAMTGKVDDEIFVAMDAGRGEFYFGVYGMEHTLEELIPRDELVRRVDNRELFVYENALHTLQQDGVHVIPLPVPTAVDCVGPALLAYARGEFADLATLDANYLRTMYVERKGLQAGPAE